MSEENLEIVRRVFSQWGRGNFRAGVELFEPDTELVLRSPLPEAGTYRGPEEIRGYMMGFLETWGEVVMEGENFEAVGEDRVVVGIHQHGTGVGSRVPVGMRYFQVWTLEDGKIARMESVKDRADAMRAAEQRE